VRGWDSGLTGTEKRMWNALRKALSWMRSNPCHAFPVVRVSENLADALDCAIRRHDRVPFCDHGGRLLFRGYALQPVLDPPAFVELEEDE